MSIKSYFFNAVKTGNTYDRMYNAADMTNYLQQIVGNGVFPTPSTQLQVRAGTGMQVIVNDGEGWINGHKLVNNADMTLPISQSDVLLDRIDSVIFYLDETVREMGISILQGTPAASPVAPSLTRTSTRYEMCLAQVSVGKQVTEITNAMITDTRADSTICGWVAGLIQQLDTTTLFQQWEAVYQNYYNTMSAQFDAWFSTLTEQLQVNTYLQNYDKRVNLQAGQSRIIPLDMNAYTYEESDIFFVYINGLYAAENVDYYLDTTTTPVQMHVNVAGGQEDIDIRVLKSKIGFEDLNS